MRRRFFLAALTLSLSLVTVMAEEKRLLNLGTKGLALQGYDPVAYFTVKAAVKGKPEITTDYEGATYRFRSESNRTTFLSDPKKYSPQFGGYCAYGVSRGKLVPIDPEAFQIVDGRLLLQYSKGVLDDFNKDASGNLQKADHQWPRLVDKNGK